MDNNRLSKKRFWIILLCAVVAIAVGYVAFVFGQKDQEEKEPERTWKDIYTVQCRHVEESKFDDEYEELAAILSRTYITEHDEYTITNKTNDVLGSVWAIFQVNVCGKSYDIEMYVGTLRQGESEVVEISEGLVKLKLENQYGKDCIPNNWTFDFYDCRLTRIENRSFDQ